MIKRVLLITCILALLLSLLSGCGSLFTSSHPAAVVEPQPGRWVANFTLENDYGNTENWVINFFVDEDAEAVSSIMLGHYRDDVSKMKVMFSANLCTFENNAFEFTIPEFRDNTNYTYKGKITFVSETEADGVLNIYKKDRKFSAALSTLEEPSNEQVD